MNKVVSIALFGDGDKYAKYLSTFVLAHHNLFPKSDGWRLYLAVDDRTSPRTSLLVSKLSQARLLDFCVHQPVPLCKAMLWRMDLVFRAAQGGEEEPWKADFVFCRDLDAIPMPRDRACCDEYIKFAAAKGCAMHTVHDNLMHEGIMGGLCGFHAPAFRAETHWQSLEDLYRAANVTDGDWARHGMDQLVLNRLLLRVGGPRLFEHRFAGWHAGPGRHPARGPGRYACGGVSAPVPDADYGRRGWRMVEHPLGRYEEQADLLGNHLGCAGYNVEAARRFWELYGDPDITAAVKVCEEAK